jgi:hypothetical protein
MVWPSGQRRGDFDRVVESHQLAATDVDGVLLPVGAAWRSALRSNDQLRLYSVDSFHPSELGSFLAAWVIFRRLYGGVVVTMPRVVKVGSKTIELTESQVNALTAAADEVLK